MRCVSRSDSTTCSYDTFEELTDLLGRELQCRVADVELEALQGRTFRVVGATEHPDPVVARHVEHPSSHSLTWPAHANVHHGTLDGKGEYLDALDSIQYSRNLLRALVVVRKAITAQS